MKDPNKFVKPDYKIVLVAGKLISWRGETGRFIER